jgi:hypothetical protein
VVDGCQKVAQALVKDRAAFRAAQGIEFQGQVFQAQLGQKRPEHEHDLGVGLGRVRAQDLHVELMELAQAAFLRALVAEHGAAGEELGRPVGGMHWPDSMKARSTPAVASGRMVRERPLRSAKVYISFCTTSVSSPMERAKSSVFSRMGTRTSWQPYVAKTWRARFSIRVWTVLSGLKRSEKPLIF